MKKVAMKDPSSSPFRTIASQSSRRTRAASISTSPIATKAWRERRAVGVASARKTTTPADPISAAASLPIHSRQITATAVTISTIPRTRSSTVGRRLRMGLLPVS